MVMLTAQSDRGIGMHASRPHMNLLGRRHAGSRPVGLRVGVAMMALLGGVFVAAGSASPATAAPIAGGDITEVCVGTNNVAAKTFTLTADCGEVTSPLTVPSGYTIEGGGHIITATDPRRRHFQWWRGDERRHRTFDAREQRHYPIDGVQSELHDCKSGTSSSGRTPLQRCRRHHDRRDRSGHHSALRLPDRQRDTC